MDDDGILLVKLCKSNRNSKNFGDEGCLPIFGPRHGNRFTLLLAFLFVRWEA